jgi:hypothetical protein
MGIESKKSSGMERKEAAAREDSEGADFSSTGPQVMDELSFFTKLDHPNCHYLLGAKTTLENGGILVREREKESGGRDGSLGCILAGGRFIGLMERRL